MTSAAALCPDTILGDRFVVRRPLGAGAFGAVYLADQRVFGLTLRRVALKLFYGDKVDETNARERLGEAAVLMRFQEEMRLQKQQERQLATRHLVAVLDAGFLSVPDESGEPERRAFVAMEYVPGYRLPSGQMASTLQDMIPAFGRVPVDIALAWMIQILRGVAWMHTLEPPVLHCDLKADNIIPDGPDTLKVADFGLSQLAFETIGLRGGAGALACQAPETLAGVEPTTASDVYSLGLLLHEILAGESPLAAVGLAETADGDTDGLMRLHLEARQAGIPPLTEAVNPDLARHPLVTEIVGKCLRLHAPQRYANAKTLLDDIEAYTSGEGELPGLGRSLWLPAGTANPLAGSGRLARLVAEAEALSRAGRAAEGRARADAALAAFPDAVAAHACQARMCLTEGHWGEASRLCAVALALDGVSDVERAMLLELSAEAYGAGGLAAVAASMRDRAAAVRRGALG